MTVKSDPIDVDEVRDVALCVCVSVSDVLLLLSSDLAPGGPAYITACLRAVSRYPVQPGRHGAARSRRGP